MGILLQATRTVPIVFTQTAIRSAVYVANLARPGGNVTGFIDFEYGMGAKWLELLKQIAPGVTRAAVLRDPAIAQGIGQFGAIQSVAPSLGLEVSPVNVRDAGEIEHDVTAFARVAEQRPDRDGERNGDQSSRTDRRAGGPIQVACDLLRPLFVTAGGLISYGADASTRTGERPATSIASSRARFRPICRCRRRPSSRLVINLKTAKALGLTIPPSLLATANEVIE